MKTLTQMIYGIENGTLTKVEEAFALANPKVVDAVNDRANSPIKKTKTSKKKEK